MNQLHKKPFFINLACNGSFSTSRYVPCSNEEIIADIAEALELGVQIFHIHARLDQKHTSDPEPYGRIIESIRTLPGGHDAILCVTTSGRIDNTFELRSQVLDLDGNMKPDMASLSMGSFNFMQSASINPPDVIRRLAQKMLEKKIRPELEIFDLGMINFTKVLLKEKLLQPPLYINLFLGNIGSAQVDPIHLGSLLSSLPEQCIYAIAGLGRYNLTDNALGLLFADGVRTGLEDNIWQNDNRSQLATNISLIKRILKLAKEFERPLMSHSSLHQKINIQRHL